MGRTLINITFRATMASRTVSHVLAALREQGKTRKPDVQYSKYFLEDKMFIWLIWYGQGTNSCLYQGRCQRITSLCCWGVWWHGWTAGNYFPQFFPIDNHKFKKIEFFIFLQLSWKSLQIMLILVQKLFAFLYWTLSFLKSCFDDIVSVPLQASIWWRVLWPVCWGILQLPWVHTYVSLLYIRIRMSEYYFDNCLFLKSLYTLWYLFQFNFLHFVDFSNLSFFFGTQPVIATCSTPRVWLATLMTGSAGVKITLEWCWNDNDIIKKNSKNCVLISLI